MQEYLKKPHKVQTQQHAQVKKEQMKKSKAKLVEMFKNCCRHKLQRDPPPHLQAACKDKEKSINLNLQLLQMQDTIFINQMIHLPIIKIHMFYPSSKKTQTPKKFHQTSKFKQILQQISATLQYGGSIKSLSFENIPLSKTHLKIIGPQIASSHQLKELSLCNCFLTDLHLAQIKQQLEKSQSLAILNLSFNCLKAGKMIAQIISKHSARRDEIVWMQSLRSEPEEPWQDPSKRGLCQINLQNNQINEDDTKQIIRVLRDDQWTRCINLRNNKIEKTGIRQFAMLMKKNFTIISLDLRDNPGFSKEYSMYIIRKLRQNIERYRQFKQKHEKSISEVAKLKSKHKKQDKHKSMEQSRRKSLQNKIDMQFNINNTSLGEVPIKPINNNSLINSSENSCIKCKTKTLQLFRLQKKNLDLQIELKRVKKVLLQKNIDVNISAIEPQQLIQHNLAFESFQKITGTHAETDEELISKVQQIMMELTKIMENIQSQQTTDMNIIENSDSNVNSLSNTIPLFSKHEDFLEMRENEEEDNSRNSPDLFMSQNYSQENQGPQ